MSIGGTTTANGPSSTTEQAKDKAQEVKGQAKNRVSEQVDQRSTQAGEQVSSTAPDIRSVADELRKQGKDQPAKLAEQAAQRAETLGDYLQRSDGDTILRDLEDFGRRQPWAVIAGGVALGFAASRFLKASSRRRYEQRDSRARAAPARPDQRRSDDVVRASDAPIDSQRQRPGTVVTDPSARGRRHPVAARGTGRSPLTRLSRRPARPRDRRARQGSREPDLDARSARRSSSRRPRSRRRASSPARAPGCSPARPSPRCSGSAR